MQAQDMFYNRLIIQSMLHCVLRLFILSLVNRPARHSVDFSKCSPIVVFFYLILKIMGMQTHVLGSLFI